MSYRESIKILIEEISPVALERIAAEHLACRESVVVVARVFNKTALVVASDVKRKIYKEKENDL